MRIRNPLLIKLLSRSMIGGLRALCRTTRVEIHTDEPGTSLYDDPQEIFLYSAWHDAILLSLLCRKPASNMAALVSQHRDGGYITDLLNALKIIPVRGSTSKGAVKALREMIRVSRENHVAITSDGPRGPRRQVSSGLIYLASKTGRRIVPAGYSCVRSWSVKGSWTDMQIPKPFTKVHLVGETPIAVPKSIDRDGIVEYTRLLQAAMDRANDRADAYARGENPDAKPDDNATGLRRAA